jgi:hypothetical protein
VKPRYVVIESISDIQAREVSMAKAVAEVILDHPHFLIHTYKGDPVSKTIYSSKTAHNPSKASLQWFQDNMSTLPQPAKDIILCDPSMGESARALLSMSRAHKPDFRKIWDPSSPAYHVSSSMPNKTSH